MLKYHQILFLMGLWGVRHIFSMHMDYSSPYRARQRMLPSTMSTIADVDSFVQRRGIRGIDALAEFYDSYLFGEMEANRDVMSYALVMVVEKRVNDRLEGHLAWSIDRGTKEILFEWTSKKSFWPEATEDQARRILSELMKKSD
jgi:hypothetical protein